MSIAPRYEAFEVHYVDLARTHELHTLVERVDGGQSLVVTDVPFGSRDPREAVIRRETIREPWEARLAIAELEARLTLSGERYFRWKPDSTQWEALAVARAPVDLASHKATLPGARSPLRYHHFHSGEGKSQVHLSVPRGDLADERYVLASLDFRFPDVASGDLKLLHPRLSTGTLRARWLDAHIDLPKSGYKKLATTTDYAMAFGAGWQEAWRDSFARALRRVAEGDLGAPAEVAAPAPRLEVGDVHAALASPVALAVRARHFRPGAEARVLAQGEVGIRKFIRDARRNAAHDEQPGLSLLEAILLYAYARNQGRLDVVEEEGRRVARMVAEFNGARAPAAMKKASA